MRSLLPPLTHPWYNFYVYYTLFYFRSIHIFLKNILSFNVTAKSKLKKLFVPMLIILKLFKLKLLLLLPLILGLASFKKVLGFLALVIPGLIGFFKLCKPELHQNYGSFGHSDYYHSPPHKYDLSGYSLPDRRKQTTLHTIEGQDYAQNSFMFDENNNPHNLAYQSYYQQQFNNR